MDDHKYWVEEPREGEIEIVCRGDIREAIERGAGFQSYIVCDPASIDQSPISEYADTWYTHRNGDTIVMYVPKGTKPEMLPSRALNYIAFWWSKEWDSAKENEVPTAFSKKFKKAKNELPKV